MTAVSPVGGEVLACGCRTSPAHVITDPERHAAWHQLVQEQGGPAGLVDANTLRAARGFIRGNS